MANPVNLFQDISGDNPEVTEMESLCMACNDNGSTRLMTVKIPYYKEVIVSSFSCPHCGYENTSAMEGERIQDKGVEYQLHVKEPQDLNRSVVMSELASLKIPELEFEAPYKKQTFGITTVEGLLMRVKEMLEKYLEARRKLEAEEDLRAMRNFIGRVEALREIKQPFHIIIDDPSGNSFIQNIHAPNIDAEMTFTKYKRTPQLDLLCGLQPQEEEQDDVNEEVLVFPATCYNCGNECETNMKNCQIPHFQEVLVMSTVCDQCGWRENEVKPSGGISEDGQTIDLSIEKVEDLARDVIKSSTCSLRIPELDFDMLPSEHSSRYTTIEGLLINIKDLVNRNPFAHGDSARSDIKEKLAEFTMKLDEIISGTKPGHLLLNDPAGNSFIQAIPDLDHDDRLKITSYERTAEQNDELCITHMKTENYSKNGEDSSIEK